MIKKIALFYINYIKTDVLKKRIKPRVLQMPITSRCNSRCVTCNIWKDQKNPIDINAEQLKKALMDPYFSEVTTIGLNGGEPSTYKDIVDLLDALSVVKKLSRIYVISNGIITHRLTDMMREIKQFCSSRGIIVYLTISLDGVGEIHNTIRGVPNVFAKTTKTILEIKNNKDQYCDELDLGFTISNNNVEYIIEGQEYIKSLGIPAYYHPAVPNNRLHNFDRNTDFSIMHNKRSMLLATEYFYSKFKNEKGLKTRLRAFLTYRYLLSEGKERLSGCNYLRSDVTITENLDICLCATASNAIGNLKESNASQLMSSRQVKEEEYRVSKLCHGCVHYMFFPTFKGLILFIAEILKPSVWLNYKLRAIWLR